MTGPPAATAAVRVAVRRCLVGLDGPVAAAVSGGADSLALAAALAHERPGSYAVVVDHGLQDGSGEVAGRAAEQCAGLGLHPLVLHPAPVPPSSSRHPQHAAAGDAAKTSAEPGAEAGAGAEMRAAAHAGAGAGGPEARARALRYAALDAVVTERQLAAVLLGHTLDDQAETVLLGLARGAGARALAGMADRPPYLRPLLRVDRATTRRACAEAGLSPWHDPHNADGAYARVRVRERVLPVLEAELGPGVAAALARTAAQLREDADALDALTPVTDDVAELAALPPALRSRAVKRWAERACGSSVSSAHVDALRALVDAWRGQGPVALPGGIRVGRAGGRLTCVRDR